MPPMSCTSPGEIRNRSPADTSHERPPLGSRQKKEVALWDHSKWLPCCIYSDLQ
jgi:hypothetical protein